jgi:hypothetical protein
MARMALGEALTNLVWAPLTSFDDIKVEETHKHSCERVVEGLSAVAYMDVPVLWV